MTALNINSLLFEKQELYIPDKQEIVNVLAAGLCKDFKHVDVNIVDCPALNEAPYHLAGTGLGGSPTLIEIGSPAYLLPLVDKTKLYDLKLILEKIGGKSKPILGIGAGAGPHNYLNQNCEGIFNLSIDENGKINNHTHVCRVKENSNYELMKLPEDETKLALLGNIFQCEAKPGKVIRVTCKQRIGDRNYIEAIRLILTEHFGDKTVGLGGVFIMNNGKAKQHVMQDFSKTPINTENELNNWLKFYQMEGPLISVGTLITNEADLDLRLQHFHNFSKHGCGGHYHYDTTPDTIEYEGYFNIAEKVVRIDKPLNAHKIGRD